MISISNMTNNEIRKSALLITEAIRLEIDLTKNCQLSVDNSTGWVVLWMPDHPFILFLNLGSDNVWAQYINRKTGSEFELTTAAFNYRQILSWIEKYTGQH